MTVDPTEARQIITAWPCTWSNNGCMNTGSTPSLLPIGSKYKKESHFGLRKVMRFAPPDVSRESKSYPAMSALIPAWLQTLGKEMQSEHLIYTSVTLCNTLESSPFNTSSHVGMTMVLDLEPDRRWILCYENWR